MNLKIVQTSSFLSNIIFCNGKTHPRGNRCSGEVKRIVSNLNIVTTKKLNLVSNYIFSLTVKGTRHSFETMGRISDCDPSRFSHLLNHPDAVSTSSKLLNRLLRRKLSKVKIKKERDFYCC